MGGKGEMGGKDGKFRYVRVGCCSVGLSCLASLSITIVSGLSTALLRSACITATFIPGISIVSIVAVSIFGWHLTLSSDFELTISLFH